MSTAVAPAVSTAPGDAPQPLVEETDRELKTRIFRLAWPMVGETSLHMTMELVNVALISALGAAALAGAGAALQVMQVMVAALTALSVGASILVSHAIGSGDRARAGRLARQALSWSIVLAVPMGVAGWFGAPRIVDGFGFSGEATATGTAYLQVAMGTVIVLVVLLLSTGVLRGAGDSRTPMLVTLAANGLNVVLAWALIHGHLGLPEMGVVGAAWATFTSRLLAVVLVLAILWRGRAVVSIRARSGWRLRWGVGREILGLGTPAAGEQLLISGAWLAFTVLVAHIGTTEMAVQRVAMTVLSIVFLPAIGVQLATTALVGQAVGAGRPDVADRIIRITTRWSLVLVLLVAGSLFAGARPVMEVFSDDPAVVAMGVATLQVMLLTQPFWAVTMQQTGALRGMRDTVSPLVIEAVVNWTAVALAAYLIQSVGVGLAQAWVAYVVVGPPLVALTVWRRRRRVAHLRARLLPVAPGESRVPV